MEQAYLIIGEVHDFEISDYIPHLGWISSQYLIRKIYTEASSHNFFLHDEQANRLFEFSAFEPSSLNSTESYQEVINLFKSFHPEIFND
ncbi:hypothetical protein SAMN04487996_111274 [Dyadobacter soli]|uniref:Uncharacterized protein n=1 Tax=Dyadobacter soli TaxID=659014 RepID=A0A1G7MHD6_9BACT|nr:hypothetical protein [Dyadobacter soli]SDF61278.1 hypothetical protein SAMN04487996_111274 [Dyadobacter soli]